MTETGKLRVGVMFGGRSGEHAVSLMSARSVLSALNPEKYDLVQIGITTAGRWLVSADGSTDVIDALEKGAGLSGAAVLPDPSRPGLWSIAAGNNDRLVHLADLDVPVPARPRQVRLR